MMRRKHGAQMTKSNLARAVAATATLALIAGMTTVIAAPAAADGDGLTNLALKDGVAITSPKIIETEPSEGAVFSVTVDYPGYRQDDLHYYWSYASSPTGSWTTVRNNDYGVRGAASRTMTIAAANFSDWKNLYFSVVVWNNNSNPVTYPSVPFTWVQVPALDQSIPADTTVSEGDDATFGVTAPIPPYTSVRWQQKAPTADASWQDVVPTTRSLFANLVVPRVTAAENGSQYRPVYLTANGVPHYGRAATLTVTPATGATGILYSTGLHAFRYYVKGVDQNSRGIQTIGGKTYFFTNGSLRLGYVADPLLPGGNSYFTLANGMAFGRFVRDGDRMRYFDASGAMRTTAGVTAIDGKEYSFDAAGRAVQVLSEYELSKNAGPGVLLLQIVQVGNGFAALDVRAISNGALGGTKDDKVSVGIGETAMTFSLDEKAQVVAQALQQRFRNFTGQTTVRDLSLDIDIAGQAGVRLAKSIACADGYESDDELGLCIPTAPPAQESAEVTALRARLHDLADTTLSPLQAMSADDVATTLGGAATAVSANMAAFAKDPTSLTGSVPAMTGHSGALATLRTAAESQLVQPKITSLNAQYRQAFTDELTALIPRFNDRDAALPLIDDQVRAQLAPAENALSADLPLSARNYTSAALVRYLGASYETYQEAVDSAYLSSVDRLGPTDPSLASAIGLNATAASAADYQTKEETETAADFRLFAMMLEILRATPAAQPDGSATTFTYDTLEDEARVVLGLPTPR
jgi:hypothetical protein